MGKTYKRNAENAYKMKYEKQKSKNKHQIKKMEKKNFNDED